MKFQIPIYNIKLDWYQYISSETGLLPKHTIISVRLLFHPNWDTIFKQSSDQLWIKKLPKKFDFKRKLGIYNFL